MSELNPLKPCPFCGGRSVLQQGDDPRTGHITFVLCNACGAVTSFRPNKVGRVVVELYNKRATP